jgi:hypothetical protein
MLRRASRKRRERGWWSVPRWRGRRYAGAKDEAGTSSFCALEREEAECPDKSAD